jgi:hypothetical protein
MHIRISSCFLGRYEFPKDAIEKLIFRDASDLTNCSIANHSQAGRCTQYVLFVACDPEELKGALTA